MGKLHYSEQSREEFVMERLWSRISEVYTSFYEEFDVLEHRIKNSIPLSSPEVLYEASRHLIVTGGKRIRPVLTLLAYRAVSGKSLEKVLPIALAIELIHTATIVHDDIIDKSTMRRGNKTVNAKWGNEVAILAGDLLFSEAFGLVGTHENRQISGVIARACTRLAEGEVLEALHTRDFDMSEEVYLEVIERKTASLFEAACESGALAGDGSAEAVEALRRYGFLLGIGFQIIDDLLDLTSGEGILGKPVGSDIALGKSTLPILYALRNSGERDRETLLKILRAGRVSREDLEKIREIATRSGAVKYAMDRAKHFVSLAREQLEVLPESPARRALEIIAEHIVEREF